MNLENKLNHKENTFCSVHTNNISDLLPPSINHLSFTPNIEEIKQWLSQLPIANAPKTCEVFLDFLKISNERQIQLEHRLQLSELIKKNLDVVGPALNVRFLDRNLPFDNDTNLWADLGLNCNFELGKSFQIIIEDNAFAELPRRLQGLVLFRFLECQSQNMLRYALLYRTHPAGFWKAIYKVYNTAELMNLHDENLELIDVECDASATIGELFRQILLFSLCQSDRYRQQNHQQFYSLIAKFSKFSILSENYKFDGKKAAFVFRINDDRAPLRTKQNGDIDLVSRYLHIHTMLEAMISTLQTKSNSLVAESGVSSHIKSLVIELIRNFGTTSRNATRVSEKETRSYLVGFKPISDTIVRPTGEGTIPARRNATESFSQGRVVGNIYLFSGAQSNRIEPKKDYINVPEFDLVPLDDSHNGTAHTRHPRCKQNPNKPAFEMPSSEIWKEASPEIKASNKRFQRNAKKKLCGELIDSSIKGYALRVEGDTPVQLKIGELIGFPIENERVEVGVIRRISNQSDNLILGIEILSLETNVVEVLERGNSKKPLRCLQLERPGQSNSSEKCVLMQGINLTIGNSVGVVGRDSTETFSIEKLVETTASYRRYALLPLNFVSQNVG